MAVFEKLKLKNVHQRSAAIILNLFVSFFIKGATAFIGLASVPVSLDILGVRSYGIWLTLSSIIGSFYFLDFGLANGFRNKFTESIAKNNIQKAREYVTTTYVLIALIAGGIFIVFTGISQFVDWKDILKLREDELASVTLLVHFIILFFCLRLVFSIINTMLIAGQKVALSNLAELFITLLSYLGLIGLKSVGIRNLEWVGAWLSFVPILVFIIFSLVLFATIFKMYRPHRNFLNFSNSKVMMNQGIQFFLIQLASIFLNTISNVLVNNYFGPEEVSGFGLVSRYFSIPYMAFSMVLLPFWSGFTDAYLNEDMLWIKKVVRNLLILWGLYVIGIVFMIVLRTLFFDFWLGSNKPQNINLGLVLAGGILSILTAWNNIFSFFLNGIGKIRVQLLGSILICLLIVPLSYIFSVQLNLGSTGVFVAIDLCLLLGFVFGPIQYWLLIRNKAKGIWNK